VVAEFHADVWDKQIEADVKAGVSTGWRNRRWPATGGKTRPL